MTDALLVHMLSQLAALLSAGHLKSNEQQLAPSKAEYKAIANATVKTIWIVNLFKELCFSIPNTPTICCDNLGATFLYKNPAFHTRMKHLDLDYHFVQKLVQDKSFTVRHVSSSLQLVHSLKKIVLVVNFISHRSKIGVFKPPPIVLGE